MSFLSLKPATSTPPFSIDDAFDIPEDIKEENEDEGEYEEENAGGIAAGDLRTKTPILKATRLGLTKEREGEGFSGDPPLQGDNASLIQNSLGINGSSKGSTGGGYYEGPPPVKYWWRHPKIRQNWKVMTAAFCLCFIGTGLFLGGIVAYALPTVSGFQGAVFLIAGIICFVPGAYHIGYVYLAVKGKRGYEFHHLPLFNN